MKFIVKRYEVWEQEVEVEAKDEMEAVKKAVEGDGDIHNDPQFKDYMPAALCRVIGQKKE